MEMNWVTHCKKKMFEEVFHSILKIIYWYIKNHLLSDHILSKITFSSTNYFAFSFAKDVFSYPWASLSINVAWSLTLAILIRDHVNIYVKVAWLACSGTLHSLAYKLKFHRLKKWRDCFKQYHNKQYVSRDALSLQPNCQKVTLNAMYYYLIYAKNEETYFNEWKASRSVLSSIGVLLQE